MSYLPLAAFALAALLAPPVIAAQPDRGRDLYELRCQGCHAESVHSRTKRVARSFDEVRDWVIRWNASLGAGWTAEEIDDVTLHLNTRYYRYPCPVTVCKVVSQAAPVASPGVRR
jgi:hypothetical protein